MITITPNTTPVLNVNQNNRFPQQNGTVPQRFQNPVRQNYFQPFRAYRQGGNGPLVFDPEFDGKRLRKSAMRKTVDYNSAIIKMLEARVWQRDFRDRRCLQPDAMYIPDLMPPSSYEDNPINAVTTRFVKTATNKMRCPIFCMAWTPEGRRLVTGASSGEFTLWNGLTFNFETILQAHDTPVRTMVWSHNELWMVTADHAGYVKYWQSNMNNVKMFMAHQDAIRGISFSPSDSKFASCSDDGTIKIWDFYRCQEERTLRGHGADVKCVHWHPQKALIISGSKDNQQPVKLWDPKTGTSLSTIHAHKSTVMDVKWNDNGNWFVTASRDHLLKLFDIRNLSNEVQVFRGHKKEASSVAWHPIHEGLFCSGGSDGAILFWHVGAEKEVGAIEQAHDSIVWTLAWHPMGHILCSGSNDHTSKFWTRNRPGDSMRDKYNLNTVPPSLSGLDDEAIDEIQSVIPGMGPEDKVEMNTFPLPGLTPGAIPGLDDLDIIPDDKGKAPSKKVPYSKPIPKNFQAQWNDTGKLDDIDDDSRDGLDPISILNQLIEQQPGVKLVKDLEPEVLYIYGKVIEVKPNSTLYNTIKEGGEKLMKYLNSGAVKEIRDVIPHYDDNNTAEVFVGDDDEEEESDPEPEDKDMGKLDDESRSTRGLSPSSRSMHSPLPGEGGRGSRGHRGQLNPGGFDSDRGFDGNISWDRERDRDLYDSRDQDPYDSYDSRDRERFSSRDREPYNRDRDKRGNRRRGSRGGKRGRERGGRVERRDRGRRPDQMDRGGRMEMMGQMDRGGRMEEMGGWQDHMGVRPDREMDWDGEGDMDVSWDRGDYRDHPNEMGDSWGGDDDGDYGDQQDYSRDYDEGPHPPRGNREERGGKRKRGGGGNWRSKRGWSGRGGRGKRPGRGGNR